MKIRIPTRVTSFPHSGVAEWIADEISAIEAIARGRFARTSHFLILALDALASETSTGGGGGTARGEPPKE